MNCKPGDLAVYVSGFQENIGAIVKVICLDDSPVDSGVWWKCEALSQIRYQWSGGGGGGFVQPGDVVYVADRDLRPLRPDSGTDETLTWAGKPQCVPV